MRFQKKHGWASKGKLHPIYEAWLAMRKRCLNPRHKAYKNYGGRGIGICSRWMDFPNFAKDMLPTWKKGLTLERRNNDEGYSQSNCYWATWLEQENNRRDNVRITFQGETFTISQWARKRGLKKGTLVNRLGLYGWTVDQALTIPLRGRRDH